MQNFASFSVELISLSRYTRVKLSQNWSITAMLVLELDSPIILFFIDFKTFMQTFEGIDIHHSAGAFQHAQRHNPVASLRLHPWQSPFKARKFHFPRVPNIR